MFRLHKKLKETNKQLRAWSREKFLKPKVEIEMLMNRVKEIQDLELIEELRKEKM